MSDTETAPAVEVAPQSTEVVQVSRPRPEDNPDLSSLSLGEAKWIGNVFAASGFFKDARQEAQAITKVIAGQELGLKPMQAMTNIHVFDGKVTLAGTLIARMIKGHKNYRYRLLQSDEKACLVEISERVDGAWVALEPNLGFTIEEASEANLFPRKDNWRNYPSDMLFARAISRAGRRHCPDVLGGVYSTEEFADEHEFSSPQEARADQLDEQGAELAKLATAPEKVEPPRRKAESEKIAEKVLERQTSSPGETAATSPVVASEAAGGDVPTTPETTEPSGDPPAAALTLDEPPEVDDIEERKRWQADVTSRIKALAAIIGAERTEKGYLALKAKVGIGDGEAYSSEEQVNEVCAGLDQVIAAYSQEA